ncbi:MAG: SAM-dependent methyltransferase, partial [Gammaproteobacteria bacterium]|nr:SAM-dependent methyltransferase [Gammaproteobacteria bacterium]
MRDWFDTSLGRFVLREEQRHCARLVPAGYYPNALQVGRPAVDFLRGVETGQRFLVVGRGAARA